MSTGSPVDVLYDLGVRVTGMWLTEDEAVRRVERERGFGLRSDDRDTCFSVGDRALIQDSVAGVVFARLVMVAAQQVGGEDRQSPWWWAVDLLVRATTFSLVNVPDQRRLRDAVSAVDAKIEVLRREVRRPFGRRRSTELARALLSAAKLYITPYEMNVDDLDLESGLELWQRLQKLALLGMPEKAPSPMPSVREAAGRARIYLDEALEFAADDLVGRCVVAVMDAMELDPKAGDQGRREDLLRMVRPRLDLRRTPTEYLRTEIRWLTGHPDERHRLVADIGSPAELAALADGLGAMLAYEVVWLLLRARPDSEDFVSLWREGQRLGRMLGPSYSWQLFRHVVHSFPDDQNECANAASLVDLATAMRKIERRVAEGEETPEAGAATLVHLAAHAPDGRRGMDAIALARRLAPEFAAEYESALDFLLVRLAMRTGRVSAQAGTPEASSGIYFDALDEAERLRYEALSAEMINDLLYFARMVPPDTEDRAVAVGAAFLAAITLLPGLPVGNAEGLAEYTRSVGVQLDRLLRTTDTLGAAVLHHHRVFKGFEVDTLLGEPGPRRLTDGLESQFRQIDAQFASPFRGGSGNVFGDAAPADMELMCYASTHESGLDPADRVRRVFDAAFTRHMLFEATGGRYPFGSDVGDVSLLQTQLPHETVFLSMYLGTSDGDPATSKEGAHMTIAALTTESYEVVRRDLQVSGGVLRILGGPEDGGKAFLMHSIGILVGTVREALNADPLIGDTTHEGARWLKNAYYPFGVPRPEQLRRWRAAGKTHLCFWPHGPLHYAPLHLVHNDGKPLSDDWTITTVPSGMMLMRPRTPPQTLHLTVIGTNSGGSQFGFHPQPEIEQHVHDVAAMTPHSTVLAGRDATPRRTLAAAEHSTYLHIAAHGSNDIDAAWFQCLYLDADHDNDGRLYAHEIIRADLRGVELVALCACETALGRFDRNDNLRGLPAAFLAAGASTVVGTLWPVTAEAATLFFTHLFSNLLSGVPKRESFRAAQVATRAAFPFYCDWGAFMFIGDWR